MQTIKELSKTYAKTLTFLQQWQEESHLHHFYSFHNMELHDLEDITKEFLDGQWDAPMTNYFTDKLYAFAVDGSGGYYAFWVYPDLDKKAPIIYLDSHGDYAYLADSFELYFKTFLKDVKSKDLDEYEYKLESSVERYEDKNDVELDENKIEEMLTKDLDLFENKMNQLIGLDKISDEAIDHPSLDLWWNRVLLKSREFYYLGSELSDITQLPKMLRVLSGFIYSDVETLEKPKIIEAFRENHPKFYATKMFEDWAKVKTTTDEKDILYIEFIEYQLRACLDSSSIYEYMDAYFLMALVRVRCEKGLSKQTLINILNKINTDLTNNNEIDMLRTTLDVITGVSIPEKNTPEYKMFEYFLGRRE